MPSYSETSSNVSGLVLHPPTSMMEIEMLMKYNAQAAAPLAGGGGGGEHSKPVTVRFFSNNFNSFSIFTPRARPVCSSGIPDSANTHFIDEYGNSFFCIFQFLEARKALFFGFIHLFYSIVDSTTPEEVASLTKDLNHFNEDSLKAWDRNAFRHLHNALSALIRSNTHAHRTLMSAAEDIFICVSNDEFFGTGTNDIHHMQHNPAIITGKNAIGICLMNIRSSIISNTPYYRAPHA